MVRCSGTLLVAVIANSGNIYVSSDNGANWRLAFTSAGTLTNADQRPFFFAETSKYGGQFGSAANAYFNATLMVGA